jgi:hypothetical protein
MLSEGEGDSGSGEAGISIADRRRVGDPDGDSGLSMLTMLSLMLSTLACRPAATLLNGGPKPLGGRARGLDGRSEACPLIWLDLRTNGEAFSGDNEPILSGLPAADDLVGELVGVVSLWPACEFCLRKGDWRTLPVSDPPGDRVLARNVDWCTVSDCNRVLSGVVGQVSVYTPY